MYIPLSRQVHPHKQLVGGHTTACFSHTLDSRHSFTRGATAAALFFTRLHASSLANHLLSNAYSDAMLHLERGEPGGNANIGLAIRSVLHTVRLIQIRTPTRSCRVLNFHTTCQRPIRPPWMRSMPSPVFVNVDVDRGGDMVRYVHCTTAIRHLKTLHGQPIRSQLPDNVAQDAVLDFCVTALSTGSKEGKTRTRKHASCLFTQEVTEESHTIYHGEGKHTNHRRCSHTMRSIWQARDTTLYPHYEQAMETRSVAIVSSHHTHEHGIQCIISANSPWGPPRGPPARP